MKRGKKIVIHIIVITTLVFASCYFGGFYFSQHACTVDYLKALDKEKETPILSVKNGKKIYVLTGGQIENQYSVIYLKKVGFLYQSDTTTGTFRTTDEEDISVHGWSCEEDGEIIFIKRNNPEIKRIEMKFEDGRIVDIQHWTEEFAVYQMDVSGGLWQIADFRCYDANNQVIYEMTL